MYKMIIVDDENVEREGMVHLVEWSEYQVDIVGSAWNGAEGLELIRQYHPDIVLTDIKMPIMNGIEMIRRAKQLYEGILYIILSGYGEYEFTSQAMELGVKHYILKPCDREKLKKVMSRVMDDIQEYQKRQDQIEQLYPAAKEQFFRKNLQGENVPYREYEFYEKSCNSGVRTLRLLALRMGGQDTSLKRFVVRNIFDELAGEDRLILETDIDNTLWILIAIEDTNSLRTMVMRTKNIYARLDDSRLDAAVSEACSFYEITDRKKQVEKLFLMQEVMPTEVLLSEPDLKKSIWEKGSFIGIPEQWEQLNSFEGILYQLALIYAKLEISTAEVKQKCLQLSLFMQLVSGSQDAHIGERMLQSRADFFQEAIQFLGSEQIFLNEIEPRLKDILLAIYLYLDQEELGIQWLAKDILYMNEEYLGRYFHKQMKEKLSVYIQRNRITMAEKLLRFHPEISQMRLTELVGFPADGQYFSRLFKKHFHVTLREYRKKLEI
ncbi:two-component system response regulator YesN [Hungatella effluvii]|uniref:Stage 0 sporulation protein A homolog n=2 Tax=Hungatella effluvii TaxID=1096246 RepID=A0A2V3Y1M1_9FIRM|nr:two-component system response regulator YesN [Hungatella effluvii]